jgi:hypothetical protein
MSPTGFDYKEEKEHSTEKNHIWGGERRKRGELELF